MSAHSLDAASEGGTSTAPSFVCPFCGATYFVGKPACSRCDSNLVVPIDDPWVYEMLLPLCGDIDGV